MKNCSWLGILLALAAAVLWGTTGTAQSFAPGLISPYWIGALRLVIAAAFLAVYVSVLQRPTSVHTAVSTRSFYRTLLAGLCVASYNLAFFAGIKLTGVAVGTTLAIGSGPLFAGLLQARIAQRTPSATWWIGTGLAIGGGAAMALGTARGLHVDAFGVALCLVAGLAYSSYTLLAKSLSNEGSPARTSLRIFAAAAVFAVPAAWLVSEPASPGLVALGPAGWLVVAYLGVVATGIAYLCFSHALKYISGATGVALALAEPLTAFALAVAILGEHPGPAGLVGLSMVMSGLAIVVRVETLR